MLISHTTVKFRGYEADRITILLYYNTLQHEKNDIIIINNLCYSTQHQIPRRLSSSDRRPLSSIGEGGPTTFAISVLGIFCGKHFIKKCSIAAS